MEKTIIVRYTDIKKPLSGQSGFEKTITEASVSQALEKIPEVQSINEISWKDYPYLPEVTFKIAWTATGILLKYDVAEQYVRAVHSKTNSPVYEDSCVEFFLSVDEKRYYNFEFNCTGTALIGFGTSREEREWIDPRRIEQIRRFPSMGRKPFTEGAGGEGPFNWNLLVYIPFSFFRETDRLQSGFALGGSRILGEGFDEQNSLEQRDSVKQQRNFPGKGTGSERIGEKICRANFYKCGDKLPVPHYVSWNRIETKAPDFHRPEYFGELIFT